MNNLLIIATLTLILVGCNPKPVQINYGEDHCAFCKMSIVDPKFGGALVTKKGRVFKFDAVECILPFVNENKDIYSHLLVTPYDLPGTLMAKDSVYFAKSEAIRSPMGAHLGVFHSKVTAREFITENDGEIVLWGELEKSLLP